MAVGIAAGDDGGGRSVHADAQESLGLGGGPDGVDGGLEVAIGAVLESEGHRKARGHLPVGLRFGGAGADGAPADEVGDVLRSDRVEHLGGRRQAEIEHVPQESAGEPQPLGDVVRAVQPWVHDQPLPADCCARFLEIHAHGDQDAIGDLAGQGGKAPAIFPTGFQIMNRAGPDDQEQTPVVPKDQIMMSRRARVMNSACASVFGRARRSSFGVGSTRVSTTLISEVFCTGMGKLLAGARAIKSSMQIGELHCPRGCVSHTSFGHREPRSR